MPVVQNSSFEIQTSLAGSYTTNFNVSGSNKVLYVAVAFDDQLAHPFMGVTYNGVAMTQIAFVPPGSGRAVYMFRLTAPDDGNNTLIVDWDENYTGVGIAIVQVVDANQTTPESGFVLPIGGQNSFASGITNSDDGDLFIGFMYLNNANIGNVTEDPGQTTVGSDGTNGVIWASTTAGASPAVNMGWNFSLTQFYGGILFSIAPAEEDPEGIKSEPITSVQIQSRTIESITI